MIELIGERDYVPVIHAADYFLSKNLAFFGEGSLSIKFESASGDAMGIYARYIRIETDITITMPDCSNIVNGIYSDASLSVSGGACVTVNNGAGKYSTAIRARNHIDIENGSMLNLSVRPGAPIFSEA